MERLDLMVSYTVYQKIFQDGNFWVEGEKFEFFEFDISEEEEDAACARNKKRKYIAQ